MLPCCFKKIVCLLLQHLTRLFHLLSLSFSVFSYSLLFWTINYRNVTHILGWSNSGYAKPNLAHSLCLDLSLSSPLCPIFLLEGRGAIYSRREEYILMRGHFHALLTPTAPMTLTSLASFFLLSFFLPFPPSFTTLCECCLPSSKKKSELLLSRLLSPLSTMFGLLLKKTNRQINK